MTVAARRRLPKLGAVGPADAALVLEDGCLNGRGWGNDYAKVALVTILSHARRQYPVGQGFFHAGALVASDADRPLTYVYDCGAQKSYFGELDREISAYADQQSEWGWDPHIDLLFLSHAHFDHVSGVRQLAQMATVDTVVLPLLRPEERLMAFAHADEQNAMADPSDLAFFSAFTVDPARAAVDVVGARRVIGVTGADAADAASTHVPPGAATPDAEFDDPELPNLVELPDAPDPDAQIPSEWNLAGVGRPTVETSADGVPIIRMPDTVHFDYARSADTYPWVLVTHVDAAIQSRAGRFVSVLATGLGVPEETLRKSLGDAAFLRHLVEDQRRLLARTYQDSIRNRDLNLTSMSLYSGPDPRRPQGRRSWISSTWNRAGYPAGQPAGRSGSVSDRVGWLGTGDAALREAVRRDPFLRHFAPYRSLVATMTLPHHGSAHNYSEELVTDLGPRLCVAPADHYGRYNHPSAAVIGSVARHAIPLQVSGDPESGVTERVRVW